MTKNTLRVAVPTGRYGKKIMEMVEKAKGANLRLRGKGELVGDIRKGPKVGVKTILAPLIDIPNITRSGKADIGFTQQFALENDRDGLLEIFKLKFGGCAVVYKEGKEDAIISTTLLGIAKRLISQRGLNSSALVIPEGIDLTQVMPDSSKIDIVPLDKVDISTELIMMSKMCIVGKTSPFTIKALLEEDPDPKTEMIRGFCLALAWDFEQRTRVWTFEFAIEKLDLIEKIVELLNLRKKATIQIKPYKKGFRVFVRSPGRRRLNTIEDPLLVRKLIEAGAQNVKMDTRPQSDEW